MNDTRTRPKKSLGQNFLVDNNIARKIVESADIELDDVVVEIGCGRGALTKFLLDYPIYYICYEIDKNLFPFLEHFQSQNKCKDFEIIFEDFLNFDELQWIQRINKQITLLGNIPYYLSSQILFKILDNRKFYRKVVLMVQREVANRIVAEPKTKDYGILSVVVQTFSNVQKMFDVSPKCFFPPPKVYSSVISIKFKPEFLDYDKYQIFKKIVRLSFNRRRKILANSLFKRLGLPTEIVQNDEIILKFSSKRAEELSSNDYLELVELLTKKYPDNVQVFDRRGRI